MSTVVRYEGRGKKYDLIARKFIRSLENATDSSLYAIGAKTSSPGSIAKRELMDSTRERSNILYLRRYLVMFGDLLEERSISDYESQIESRQEKRDLIWHYHSQMYSIGSSDRIEELMNSIDAYAKENRDLAKSSLDIAQNSDRKSRHSMAIAAVSCIATIATLIISMI